jgi:hypothetical protein
MLVLTPPSKSRIQGQRGAMASPSPMRMKANLLAIIALVSVAVFCAAGEASQQAAKTAAVVSQGVIRPEGLKWAPLLLGTAQIAPVASDPSQPGAFVLRVKIPAGVRIPPHWHRSTRT